MKFLKVHQIILVTTFTMIPVILLCFLIVNKATTVTYTIAATTVTVTATVVSATK